MDRFNRKEDVETTPLMIAKDIIYSDGTLDEKVKQVEAAIIAAEKLNGNIRESGEVCAHKYVPVVWGSIKYDSCYYCGKMTNKQTLERT